MTGPWRFLCCASGALLLAVVAYEMALTCLHLWRLSRAVHEPTDAPQLRADQ